MCSLQSRALQSYVLEFTLCSTVRSANLVNSVVSVFTCPENRYTTVQAARVSPAQIIHKGTNEAWNSLTRQTAMHYNDWISGGVLLATWFLSFQRDIYTGVTGYYVLDYLSLQSGMRQWSGDFFPPVLDGLVLSTYRFALRQSRRMGRMKEGAAAGSRQFITDDPFYSLPIINNCGVSFGVRKNCFRFYI